MPLRNNPQNRGGDLRTHLLVLREEEKMILGSWEGGRIGGVTSEL